MPNYLQYLRSKRGSAISEIPPALFLLFFLAVFPMVNLIFLGVVFSSCYALNNIELREAARTPNSKLSAVFTGLQNNWQVNGLGKIAGVSTAPISNISYSKLGPDSYVSVSTTFTVKPFFSIPFFNKVPALGAPWSFSIYGKRVLENPNYEYL